MLLFYSQGMTILYLITYFFGVEFWQYKVTYSDYTLTIATILEGTLYGEFMAFYVAVNKCC